MVKLIPLAVVVAIALLAGIGCSDATLIEAGPSTTRSIAEAPYPPLGRYAGLIGTFPTGTPSADFRERLIRVAPGLSSFTDAAAAYDAVIILALAAEAARTDAPSKFAPGIVEVTRRGSKCLSYADCLSALQSGGAIDYDGQSGTIDMLPSGDPGEASFQVATVDASGSLTPGAVRSARADDDALDTPSTPVDVLGGPPADGILRLGVLLDTTGADASSGNAQRAAIDLALADVNQTNGVLGVPMELVNGDPGDSASSAEQATTTLMTAGADAVIGPVSNDRAAPVIAQVVATGRIAMSASAAGASLAAEDRGLLFRTVAPDILQARALADVVTGDGLIRPTLVIDSEPNSVAFATEFDGRLVALGGAPDPAVFVAPGPDGPAAATALTAASATTQAFVFVGRPEVIASVFTALTEARLTPATLPWYTANLSPALAPPE